MTQIFSAKLRTIVAAVAGALAVLTYSTPASANPGYLYDCTLSEGARVDGWISPRIVFVLQPDKEPQVIDLVVLGFKESPQPVKVRRRNDRLIFNWVLSGLFDSAQQIIPTFSYRATIDEASNRIDVRAKPVGFPQNFRGSGTCRRVEGADARNPAELLR